jgi:hypothetical protein
MGHMDNENEPRYTVQVRYRHGDATAEIFNNCTEVEEDEDRISFTDRNGKTHTFQGVDYHVAGE